ncbi:PREDICTED: uncharacterized protein LOC105567321 [Vollenhovia emeryi]|uniref:uncharacterized protein LOC105567321 n=1 Tax=Vollenhovia emeryi TaxID=411798 RepID=UPI0005F3AC4D|nr:PREDICTED: uncharacterized protein LOC105567321 [Vollenhovia emeryi]
MSRSSHEVWSIVSPDLVNHATKTINAGKPSEWIYLAHARAPCGPSTWHLLSTIGFELLRHLTHAHEVSCSRRILAARARVRRRFAAGAANGARVHENVTRS